MAFDLACPADLSVLRIEGADAEVLWSEVVDHAGGVDKDGGGTEPVSTFVTEIVEDAVYKILKNVQFGDGANSLTFKSLNEMVYFADGKTFIIKDNATLQLGALSGDWSISGSNWSVGVATHLNIITSGDTGAVFYCYGSKFHIRTSYAIRFNDGEIDIRNSVLSGQSISSWGSFDFGVNIVSLKLDKVFFSYLYLVNIRVTPDVCSDVHIHRTTLGFAGYATLTAKGVLVTSASTAQVYNGGDPATVTVQDPEESITTVTNSAAAGIIIEQYTCNIHVTDKDGADLASVDVDCEYAHLVEGSDSKTYKCIQDHTAVDATHKPITGTNWDEYWELYDAAGGLGGDWDTGFAYKAGAEEFATATTDANGDISEQTIDYKKWAGTSEVLEVRIHKFTFSHASYPDFVMNDIIVDHLLVWEFDMGQSTSDLTTIAATALSNVHLDKAAKSLVNKAIQNKATGAIDYYDDDGEAVILTHTPTDGESEITRTPS